MADPLYELYYTLETILKRVIDINSSRSLLSYPNNKWIWPEIPTSLDKSYPRMTIQFLNLEEKPISAGQYLSDNLKSSDTVKQVITGKLYNVTMWIGVFVKTEIKHNIAKDDGTVINAKNTLLSNLLFTNVLTELDKGESEIRALAFGHKPFEKTFNLNYEDDSKRIINSITINIPILSEIATTITAEELMTTITRNYNITQGN